jgi:hypothetical protein
MGLLEELKLHTIIQKELMLDYMIGIRVKLIF